MKVSRPENLKENWTDPFGKRKLLMFKCNYCGKSACKRKHTTVHMCEQNVGICKKMRNTLY